MKIKHTETLLVCLAFAGSMAVSLAGCGAALDGPEEFCEGKCDNGKVADRFVDLFEDPSRFEPGDLSKWTADLVTKQINGLLGEIPFFKPSLSRTDVYALEERAAPSFTIKSLSALTAGLTQAYGEQDFNTRVNALRRSYLQRNPRHVWAEARFALPNDPSLPFKVNDIGLRFGFTALQRGIDATIIAPYNADSAVDLGQALVHAPAQAVLHTLGGLPDSLDAFREMVPGQMVALHHTEGVTGFTFNGSTPVYIATVSEATLWARISAAAHVIATGELDIQMLRDEGEQLVVDVGITEHGDAREPNMHFRLAVDGYWGFAAFHAASINVGPFDVNVADIANKTVRKNLDRYFKPFAFAIQGEKVKTRHTITRLAFDLSPNAPAARRAEIERAVNLASHGVLWYAQLLAARPGSGVTELLSVDRVARRPSFYVGLQLPVLGMSFHYEKRRNVGNTTLTIGQQTQQLFWDELEKNSGWFFSEKNYKVAGIASVSSENGRMVDADYNLRLELFEKRKGALRDQLLDQVDPLLATFVGTPGLEQLSTHTDAIERYVDRTFSTCPMLNEGGGDNGPGNRPEWERCVLSRPLHATVGNLRRAAEQTLEQLVADPALNSSMTPGYTSAADFARQLLALKIAAQSYPQDGNLHRSLSSKVQIRARLTAQAIAEILGRNDARDRFSRALTDVVDMVNVARKAERGRTCWEDVDYDRNTSRTVCSDNPPSYAKQIAEVAKEFDRRVQTYRRLRSLSTLTFRERVGTHGMVGDHGTLVDVDRRGRLVESTDEQTTAAFAAIAERKAEALREFFEKMVAEAEPGFPLLGRLFGQGLGHTEHQVMAYTLLKLAGPSQVELLLKTDFSGEHKLDGNKVVPMPDLRLYGRGAQARLIDAGVFGLEELISR